VKRSAIKAIALLLAFFVIGFTSFYAYWESAPPERSCASCHEIADAHAVWRESAHRKTECSDCHGTALSSGWHSLTEKGRMVFRHFDDVQPADVRLTENQILEMMDRCQSCHTREYADWLSSGHSATYAGIFLDETHNRGELLTDSCLRCHGMFSETPISEVVQPLDIQGPWALLDPRLEFEPTIPCTACHEIHSPGSPAVRPDYSDPASIGDKRGERLAQVSFYDRHEKTHFPASELPVLMPLHEGEALLVSADERQRVCVQCHAPNAFHQAGSSDDLTPRGVPEGLSCASCHDAHSNDTRASCVNCHPRLSNCGLEVGSMNTSFADPASPNDIHFVGCSDCHDKQFLAAQGR
jgi:nitrate/TMAO reductase-like tetraheme cytochrome c subunit